MELPVKLVKVLATGHICRINAADFDASKHEVYIPEEPKPAVEKVVVTPTPVPVKVDTTPGGISTVTGEVAMTLIAATDTLEDLDKLEADERASQKNPGGRKGVLKLIADRREKLKATAPKVEEPAPPAEEPKPEEPVAPAVEDPKPPVEEPAKE